MTAVVVMALSLAASLWSAVEVEQMTSIVRNQWYVAAYGREIGRREEGGERLSRTICGESILFWRTEAGKVTAMSDRCVHRRFPLSEEPSHLVLQPHLW